MQQANAIASHHVGNGARLLILKVVHTMQFIWWIILGQLVRLAIKFELSIGYSIGTPPNNNTEVRIPSIL